MSEEKQVVDEEFAERVIAASGVLGVASEELYRVLVDELGADTVALLAHVSFQDLMERVPGAKPVKVRGALDALKGDGKSAKGTDEGRDARILARQLRDESRLLELTGGHPLLCEAGGTEHSAANIRHYQRTGTVPQVCVALGCGKVLAHARGEVSFEDGATFLTPDGLNPVTGRNEGKFPLADRALAHLLIRARMLFTPSEAWGRLEDGTLRDFYKVAVTSIEAEQPDYASVLRKPFRGLRTGGSDPFYRGQEGHVRF